MEVASRYMEVAKTHYRNQVIFTQIYLVHTKYHHLAFLENAHSL